MDKAELKLKHPELAAELIAEGEAKQLDRVTAHLALGKRSGELELALECIASGEGLTASVMERHIDSRMRTVERRERQLDSDAAGAILEHAVTSEGAGARDLGDHVADRICGKQSTP